MEYKSKLSARLEKLTGLTMVPVHVGLVEKTTAKDSLHPNNKYLQDMWSITLTYKEYTFTTSYFSGIGHRKPMRSAKKEGNRYWEGMSGRFYTEREACNAQVLKLIPPNIDDVMYCLLSDGRGAEGTFEYFCSEFGYDTDSRKALEVYLACQDTRNRMLAMLGNKLFEELSQLEH